MTVAEKIAFAEKHIIAKEGHRFSVKGRDWVRDEFWRPADGFKLWNSDGGDVCGDCLDRIGEIIEHPDDNPTRKPAHKKTGCPGLTAEPIIVTVLNLQRQDGKTFSAMAYALATLFKARNKSIAFLAASEDQATRLFVENYREAIERNPQLGRRCEIRGNRIDVPKNRNRFESLPASHRSVTGRSRTHILIDEARDIEARIVMALIPAVFSMQGIECPRGHVQIGAEEAHRAPKKCSACGERLIPWYGRIIITSSSGIMDGSEKDWLIELIEELQHRPRPNFHVLQSTEPLNPRKSTKIVGAIEDVFGSLDSTRHYVAAEVGNQWTRKGVDFLADSDIRRCIDKQLENHEQSGDPCVAFLDTSQTNDLTSLVVLADDTSRSGEPWEHVYVARLDVWDPQDFPAKIIDDREIQAHLDHHLVMFPQLRAFGIDTRGMPWAIRMAKEVRRGRPWSRLVDPWNKKGPESQIGWGLLEQRLRQLTIRLQPSEIMMREFKGVMRKQLADGEFKFVDRDRRRSHKDITESIALCCYLAHIQQMGAGKGGSLSRRRSSTTPEKADSVRAMLSRVRSGGNITSGFGPNSY